MTEREILQAELKAFQEYYNNKIEIINEEQRNIDKQTYYTISANDLLPKFTPYKSEYLIEVEYYPSKFEKLMSLLKGYIFALGKYFRVI